MTFTVASGVNDPVFGMYDLPIRMFIEKRAEAYQQESLLKDMFLMMDSKHHAEAISGMAAMKGPKPVGENGSHPNTAMNMGYTKDFTHMTWKNRLSISREAVDDAILIDLKKRPEEFVASHYRTREEFGAALYGAAVKGNASMTFEGETFGAQGADGKNLFATDHANKVTGTTQTNGFTDAFSAAALAAAETAMQNFSGEADETLSILPDTIMIPNLYALKMSVFAALSSDKQPGSANNDFNFMVGRYRVIINPYLNKYITANTAPWILMASKYLQTYGSAVWFDRVDMEVKTFVDNNTDALVYDDYSRWSAGFGDWRGLLCGGMASGGTLIPT